MHNTSENTTLGTCKTRYSYMDTLSDDQRYILIAYYATSAITNIITNGMLMIALLKTKQLQKSAKRIVFLLSVSDFLTGSIVQPGIIITLRYNTSRYSCSIHLCTEFLVSFFIHLSPYLICVISFDRYAMLRYMNRYPKVVTKQKMALTVCTLTFIAALNATITIIASYNDEKDTYGRWPNIFDIPVYMVGMGLQFLTLKAVKEYRKSVTHL